jgi:LCP family protein required for cell wall assembly
VGEGRTESPSPDLDRLTVAQAAGALGTSQDAVRKRIATGTIPHERDESGRVYVYLASSETVHKTDKETAQDDPTETVQDDHIRTPEDQKDARRIVGRRLRETREAQGRSLEEVKRAITVHAHHLEALERGDYDAIPSPLWARGFLIMYANYLGLDGDRLADELLPLRRASRPGRYLKRRWRVLLAALGALGVAATIALATIVAPYNTFTEWAGDVLQEIAPGLFLGSEPQRVVILGFAEAGTTGRDNVLMATVAEDNVGLVSISRDTPTEIPGHGPGDVGDAFAIGGPDLTRRTVAELAGDEVQHYCVIGTQGIRDIVGSMEGVRVEVPRAVSGRAVPGGPTIMLRPGVRTLNGNQALVYLQGKDLSSEAERAKRQQDFLYAMFEQALGPSNLVVHPSTLGAVLENTQTNMSGVQMLQFGGRVRALKEAEKPVEVGTLP